ncbi:MAG TPA: hypothetical protein VK843_17100 [Planctomycetota bacterium]|nr:hypothetical protein [Planctomycetota bacterium]
MSGTACVPRGDDCFGGLAALASVLFVASLASCSGDLQASTKQRTDAAYAASHPFDNDVSLNQDGTTAHNPRITPTANWDGSLDGMKTLWFESGAKRGEGRFVNGRKEDSWTFWYENGQKHWEGMYHNDLVEGVEHSWYPNGALCFEGTSVGGRRHGAFRAWYEDGQQWWKGEYRLGVRQGPFQYWRRDGSFDQKVSGVYADGKRTRMLSADVLALVEPK